MKRTLLLILLMTNVLLCYSQELTNHAPVAPNSASLGAYGATPVSYYSGTAQVSVPVYTIKTNNLNFPIALNYRGDGLKVLSEATFVGLDWTLSNTGVITRTVEGLDDLSSVGFPHHTTAQLQVGNGMDPAPDVFYYNVNGRAGSFVMDYPGTIRLLKKDDDMSIWLDPDQNFKIITEEGTTYYFAKKEYQDQTLTISSSSGTRTVNHHYLTAWYLSSVTSNTGEVMTFNYLETTRRTVSDHQSASSTTFNSLNIVPGSACTNDKYFDILHEYQNAYTSSNTTMTHAITDEVLVDNITFSGGKIQFYYSDRLDLQPEVVYQYAKKLDEVKVYDDHNIVVKDYSFTYDYVYSSTTGMVSYIDTRLRLRSFYETPWGTDPKLTYAFSYNEASSVPRPAKSDAYHETFGYYLADPTLWLLTQIRYPTGGSANFTYESQGIYGARIGKIENWGTNNEVLSCKKLIYSGGKATTSFLNAYTLTIPIPYWCTNSGSEFPSYSTIYVNYTATNLTNFLQTGPSSMGNIYGYDQVTELDGANGENGKIVYNYYNVPDQSNDLSVPSTHDQNDGLLLSQETYKNTGSNTFSLLKKTVYTPLTRNQVVIDGANFSTMGNAFSHYNIYSQEVVTTKEENWAYNNSGTLYDVSDYTYNSNYLQPYTIQKTLSDGKVLKTVNRYAYDMPQVSPYSDMVAAHMISQPVEVEKQLNGVKLNKTVNQYSNNWSALPGYVLPANVQTQKSNDPLEMRIQYNDYDGYGNSSSLSYVSGPNAAYIWGYNGLYPIAKAVNAVPGNIAFTNCEDPLTLSQTDKSGGNMVFYSNSGAYTSYDVHTGRKSFNFTNGSLHTIRTRNTLPAGKYVFSYWSKGSTPTSDATVGIPGSFTIVSQKNQPADSKGWQYHENVVNIPVADYFTISPNGGGADILIDDIRIYPVGAEMTTYTYDPLVGVTSITDARNNTTYYEYDYFHRLSNIKDQNGNIKNRYCYNYAGQSYGCLIPFTQPPATPTPDPPVGLYFRVEISNVNIEYYGSGDNYSSFQTGDVCIKLYSDPACTIPLTLSYNIPFVLTMGDNILDDLGGNIAEPDYGIFTLTAGNSSYCLGTMDLDDITHYIGSDNNPHYQEFVYHYDLTPGSNAYRTKPTIFY